ncbi:translation initiation factor 4E [Tritrichomonas foetus]|uniref:Translation initiation factor 4E n=1 Tax=Tritrichomonas foetus TaxID=1144522 RepID=A0A1J4KBM6_9EUKA|nr:translation initiation factor 4E [Tritrichomonas foetus]|eukprot:OHT07094.1 translation initiation factor 4E [Tritrichomonas foetus]
MEETPSPKSDISVHQLPNSWAFWVIQTKYEYEIDPVISFSTIEDFWKYYLQIPPIQQLKKGGLALFKEDIKPAWEDPNNKGGTRIKIVRKITKDELDYIVCAIIGGIIDQTVTAPLCGLYVLAAKKMKYELWFGRGSVDPKELAAVLHLKVQDIKPEPFRNASGKK